MIHPLPGLCSAPRAASAPGQGQGRAWAGSPPVTPHPPSAKPMSAAPVRSPTLRPHRMKKDESFLGKLGGTLARKKKAKEGEFARAEGRKERASDRRDLQQLVPSRPVPPREARAAGRTPALFASPPRGGSAAPGKGSLGRMRGRSGAPALCPRGGGSPGGTRGLARLSPAGGRWLGGRALRAPRGAPGAAGGRWRDGWGAVGVGVGGRREVPALPAARRCGVAVHRACAAGALGGRLLARPLAPLLPGFPSRTSEGTHTPPEPAFCCKITCGDQGGCERRFF